MIGAPTRIVLAVAVARDEGLHIDEALSVTTDGEVVSMTEVVGPTGTRWHVARVDPGELSIRYDAVVDGRAQPPLASEVDLITAVLPSRYVQSDAIVGPALRLAQLREFAAMPVIDRIPAARAWVASTLTYAHGSTVSTDGLPEVMASGRGVCRDFAHLLAGVLRATDLPARVVSVYAPGLVPMDFHAVVEVLLEGRWVVVDATGLAPRTGLLRIASGRDAADTAFLSNDGSGLTLTGIWVWAESDVELSDDPADLVSIG